MDVLLVLPPFAVSNTPSIGLSLLKSVLMENGIDCKILYASLVLDKMITSLNYENALSLYKRICISSVIYSMGEFLFAQDAFHYDDTFNDDYRFLIKDKVINTSLEAEKIYPNEYDLVKKIIPLFLDEITDMIINENPKIVGFSSTFQQTCASIAISNRIKEKSENIVTILGGFNSTEPMGKAILEISPSIDYAFSGESEGKLLDFCQRVLKNNLPKDRIINCDPIKDLIKIPYPDYSDYFNQAKDHGFEHLDIDHFQDFFISFESSRGCWWGSKSQCLFCGLNGCSLTYRKKTPNRVFHEIEYLSAKYKTKEIHATDNIIPKSLPKILFEEFRNTSKKYNLFYEVRPTMSFEDLFYLKMIGLESCQPGIESLNDHILELMNKKLLGINNIRFLRDCRTLKIHPLWNLLCEIPGENEKDYYDMMDFLPYIIHLTPPTGLFPIRIERYSLLHEKYNEFNLKNFQPFEIYSRLYPSSANKIDIALAFEAEYDHSFKNPTLKNSFNQSISNWKDDWKIKNGVVPGLISMKISENQYLVDDTREIKNAKVEIISDRHHEILKYLQKPKQSKFILNFIEKNKLESEFNDLKKLNYIISLNNYFLSLICEPTRYIEYKKIHDLS